MEKLKLTIVAGEEASNQYEWDSLDDDFSLKKWITEHDDTVYQYEFDTEKEKQAFLYGFKEGIGWQDFSVIE